MTDNLYVSNGNKNTLTLKEGSNLQECDSRINSDTQSSRAQVTNVEKLQQCHKTAPYSFCRNLKKTLLFFIFIFLAVWSITFFGRSLVDSILQRIDSSIAVHSPVSKIDSGVTRQVRPKVTLVYRQKDGQLVRVLADEETVSEFARESINMLESARVQLRSIVGKRIHNTVDTTFLKMREQINSYADWYFAWLTTYKILGEIIASASDHAMKPEAISLKAAIAADVEKYLQKHFEKIVLQPEISDADLKAGFESTLQDTHNEFLRIMSQLDQKFQKFVAKQSTTLLDPVINIEKVKVDLDWKSQFKKVTTAGHEKGVGGGLIGIGFFIGGAILGKTLGTALGEIAVKGFTAKLATPFVTKAVSLTGPVISGTAAGTLGGPIGAAIGAITGVGLDYAVSKGVELAERDSFVVDTNAAIDAIQRKWESDMTQSLEKAVDLWFEDSINLFSEYSKNTVVVRLWNWIIPLPSLSWVRTSFVSP